MFVIKIAGNYKLHVQQIEKQKFLGGGVYATAMNCCMLFLLGQLFTKLLMTCLTVCITVFTVHVDHT